VLLETPEDRESIDDQDDVDLEAGDLEDDGTQSDEEEEDTDGANDASRVPPSVYFNAEQINRRRNRLKKAMDSFQDLLARLSADCQRVKLSENSSMYRSIRTIAIRHLAANATTNPCGGLRRRIANWGNLAASTRGADFRLPTTCFVEASSAFDCAI
jgi:hypothetical protein